MNGETETNSFLSFERPLAPVQWAAIAGSVIVGLWSVAGLIANPDFATGDSATSELVLGVDMNGWHAVSGFLITIPGLFAATRRDLSAIFNVFAAGGLIATAVWALLSEQVAGGLFYFPHGGADALLHLGTSAIFIAGAAHWYLTGSSARRAAASTAG